MKTLIFIIKYKIYIYKLLPFSAFNKSVLRLTPLLTLIKQNNKINIINIINLLLLLLTLSLLSYMFHINNNTLTFCLALYFKIHYNLYIIRN